jgi:hypothetical protein
VTDVGFHYAFPEEWGISQTSKLYEVMQEAIDKKYYNIAQYGDIEDGEVYTRVLLQEYAYWIIYTAWDFRERYGPKKAEWSIMNSSDLKTNLPESFRFFEQTAPKVIVPPKLSTLAEFGKSQ